MDEFITRVSSALHRSGYLIEDWPQILGTQALLYARSPERIPLGAAKVEDHFLFVDWDNGAFGRLDHLKEIYRRFQPYANRSFKTPHALRMQIPNLALVAVSQAGFPEDAFDYARTTNLTPWYSGEVGQVMLVDPGQKQVTTLVSLRNGRHPKPGAFALGHAIEVIRAACEQAF
jgi:hypothetical protein